MQKKSVIVVTIAMMVMAASSAAFANEGTVAVSQIKDRVEERKEAAQDQLKDRKDQMKDRVEERKEAVQDQLKDRKDQMKDRVEERKEAVQDQLKDRKDQMKDRVEERKEAVQDQLKDRKDQMKDRVEERKEAVQDQLKDRVEERKEAVIERRDKHMDQLKENHPELFKKVFGDKDQHIILKDMENNKEIREQVIEAIRRKQMEERKQVQGKLQQIKERIENKFENKENTVVESVYAANNANWTELKSELNTLRKEMKKTVEIGTDLGEQYKDIVDTYEKLGDIKEGVEAQKELIEKKFRDLDHFKKLGKLYKKEGSEGVKAFVNGKAPKFDVMPFIREGRTLVPLRAISETLGAVVKWDNDTRTVIITKGDTVIKLPIDSKTAFVNGKSIELEVPASITEGSTFVPVRFVSENLDTDVSWEPEGQIVIINDKSTTFAETDLTQALEETTQTLTPSN